MLRVLRHRDFGLLWLGQAVSLVGDGIYLVAIAWLVLDISNEPSALALVGLAWTFPMVVALLIAGVLSIKNELGGDAATFGTVLAVGGLGSIAAAVILSLTGLPRRHVTFMWSAWGVGTGLDVGLALAGASWQICVLAFFSFGFATTGLLVWSMLMYTLVPAEMLGRVTSVDWFVSIGLTPCRSR